MRKAAELINFYPSYVKLHLNKNGSNILIRAFVTEISRVFN